MDPLIAKSVNFSQDFDENEEKLPDFMFSSPAKISSTIDPEAPSPTLSTILDIPLVIQFSSFQHNNFTLKQRISES